MRTDDSKSLKAGFVEIMEAKIFSGELKPGDRLPPERELALQLGISRGSVNQGILDMARMGFLRSVPRRGTFVADYVRNATPETLAAIMSVDSALFKDLMELRILVERECTRLACANLTPESLETLQKRLAAVLAASDEDAAEEVYLFHKCFTEISGNAAYAIVFQSFEKLIRNLIKEYYKDPAELRGSLPKLGQMTEAIARRDAMEADCCMLMIHGQASDYLNRYLRDNENRRAEG